MIPLHAWLWRGVHVPLGTEDYGTVRAAALRLEERAANLGVSLLITDDAWQYRRAIERATATFENAHAVPSVLPLLNRHVDPICRHLAPHEFFALVGTKPERPAPLLTTATGAAYKGPIRGLLVSQTLWANRPEIHAPFKVVCVGGQDPALETSGPVLHCGSTWVDVGERDKRKSLGKLMARLNVMCAWLKFGAHPIFGTTAVGKHFHGRKIGDVTYDGDPGDIIFFSPADVVADAQRALSESSNTVKLTA